MFKCEKCNKITKPHEKLHKVPVLYRDKVYENTTKIFDHQRITTSYGKEIVKEKNCVRSAF